MITGAFGPTPAVPTRNRATSSIGFCVAERPTRAARGFPGTGRGRWITGTLRPALIAGQACVCVAVGARVGSGNSKLIGVPINRWVDDAPSRAPSDNRAYWLVRCTTPVAGMCYFDARQLASLTYFFA